MLARAAGREREMAIRGALGASRARLLRRLLAESVVLALLAGVAGIAAAAFSLRAFTGLLPANTPRLAEVSLGWHVLAFAAAASIFAGLLFGLIPALRMAAPQSGDSLHSGSRTVAGKPGQFRESLALVVGQIALSVLVVTAAGLMLHSLWNLMQVNPGFRATRVVTAEVSLDADTCPSIISGGTLGTPGHCWAFFNTLLDRLRGLPGLESVALTGSLPLNGNEGNFVFDAESHPRAARQIAFVGTARAVSPGYFSALGLNLLRGRLLDAQDASGASQAVVIDKKMAEELWPNQDPLGKHIINVAAEKTPGVWNKQYSLEVVGVVSNTHEGSVASSYGMEIYEPMIPLLEMPSMYVLLRTPASAVQAADELRQAVAAIDPLVPVTHVRTLEQVVGATQSAAITYPSAARIRRTRRGHRRGGGLQSHCLCGELAHSRDRHSPGPGSATLADYRGRCTARAAAGARRVGDGFPGLGARRASTARLPLQCAGPRSHHPLRGGAVDDPAGFGCRLGSRAARGQCRSHQDPAHGVKRAGPVR
jgi:predicted permease